MSVLTGDRCLALWCIALLTQNQVSISTYILRPFIRSLLSFSLFSLVSVLIFSPGMVVISWPFMGGINSASVKDQGTADCQIT